MSIPTGTQIGPFEIILQLGAGGMGEVYRARDSRLGREVALKVLPKQLLSNREGLIRFAQEARSASSLNHPNIVTIFEIGTVDSSPFMAMELIEGLTLRDLLQSGPLPIRKAIDISAQIADGLSKAHQAGIVHRDLKPENIMLTRDGFAKILDFGVAKLQDPLSGAKIGEDASLTKAGFIIGTPDYMSPEQAAGRPLDFRSDQFSLGLLMYEMLTGRRAFHRPTTVQTLSAIIQEEVEPLEGHNGKVPPPLRWLVERCLAKDPEERYTSSRDLARELKQMRERAVELLGGGSSRVLPVAETVLSAAGVMEGATGGTAAVAIPAAVPRRSPWRRMAEFLLVLLIAGALFAGGVWTGIWFREKQIEPPPPSWKADILLGSATRVMAPRVSPAGDALAFVTLIGPASQIAVMRPASGDWTVLTRPGKPGSMHKVCWSRDGNKLFFDRVGDVPHGIYSIPPLGGEERTVIEDAQGPEALPDGSLLVVKRDAQRNFVIHRYWPETGKLAAIGPPVAPEAAGLAVRAFPDGKRAIFWGRLAGAGAAQPRHVYLLEIDTGKAAPFAPQLPLAPPIAVRPDGSAVLAFITAGDLQQVVSVSREGDSAQLLFPVTGKPWYLDGGQDGSLYVDTMDNPAELFRFPSTGGAPERISTTAGNLLMSPVELPGGGILFPHQVLGRRSLLIATPDGQLRSFLDINEQATPPAAVVGDRLVAFLSGGVGQPPLITFASLPDGRIVRRLEASRGTAPQSLAASPDGATLYYVDAGSLYSVPVAGGAATKLFPANGVAIDPRDPPSLILQMNAADGVKLSRVLLSGGQPEPIPFSGPLRLVPSSLAPSAVGPDGRIAVGVTSSDSWFRGVGLLDPKTGVVERVPIAFDGDVHFPSWSRDGSLVAVGTSLRSTLWRFRVHAVQPATAPK